MNCEEFLNLIDDLIDGEPTFQNSASPDSHLLVCPNCAASYKTAQREKEIYASYISAVAPPTDLWTKFQAKLNFEFETVSPVAEKVAEIGWKTRFFEFFRFYPSLGFAALLLMIGFAWLRFELNKTDLIAGTKLNNAPVDAQNYGKQTPEPTSQNTGGKTPATSAAISTTIKKTGISTRAAKKTAANKPATISATKTSGKIIHGDREKPSSIESRLSEREMQLIALEKAAARQIEKTELLLRSFRNARTSESEAIDLEYESRQARKLLEEIVSLRQTAENYGELSALETLDRVEPFLLDIANLEKNPLAEKVLEIQTRVKNQNIIASLQIY